MTKPDLAGAANATACRWTAVDALRGLAIAAMILVNNPGRWGVDYQYAPLRHAEWNGCTFTDLVFPTFLFVVGVAIVPALHGKLARGDDRARLRWRVLRRALTLWLLGLGLAAFPFVSTKAGDALLAPIWNVRWLGVLPRIGICYGLGALLFLAASERAQRRVLLGCLFSYWALVTLVPVPGHGWPDLDDHTTHQHLPGFVDRLVLGAHAWRHGPYDPEGLLSTIPALATVLFGIGAGRVLLRAQGGDAAAQELAVRELLLRGALLMAAGAVWGFVFPLNKALWTSSFAVLTAGIATSALGVLHWWTALRGERRLVRPFVVYGHNALLAFVGSGLLAKTMARVTIGDGATAVDLQQWLFRNLLASWAPPAFASLLHALAWVLGWYLALAWLHRRGVVWRV